MPILRVKATGNGRKVSWTRLKEGQLVDAHGFSLAPTTVLTDVVADIIALGQSLDSQSRVVMVVPNGFFRVGFNLAVLGRGFEVTCARRLVRGWFPLNPLAAEFGSNFDVVVTVAGVSEEAVGKIVGMLTSKYQCTLVGPLDAFSPGSRQRG